MKIRIILADDHQMFRDGLRAILEKHPDFEIVGEASNGRQAVEMATGRVAPQVVIMDFGMPSLNGAEATRLILAQCREVRVIALSVHSDHRFVAAMLNAGASGYLLKEAASEELTRAVLAVTQGHKYLSTGISSLVVQGFLDESPPKAASPNSLLGQREREALQLLAEGKTSKQIAMALHISTRTVEVHRRNIMEKLNLHSVAELTKYAVREGITSA